MKRVFVICMVVVMVYLAGCGDTHLNVTASGGSSTTTNNNDQPTTDQTATTTDTTTK